MSPPVNVMQRPFLPPVHCESSVHMPRLASLAPASPGLLGGRLVEQELADVTWLTGVAG
jgi:hypothetical protein